MASRLGRSAFALCVLLGATARSSAEETACQRYDAEHENNLLAYNGCMHEQRSHPCGSPTFCTGTLPPWGRVLNSTSISAKEQ